MAWLSLTKRGDPFNALTHALRAHYLRRSVCRSLVLPSLLERRRRIDQALFAVVPEAYLHGVATRKVDDLVRDWGGPGISKSEVARICADLAEEVGAFRESGLAEQPFRVRVLGLHLLQARVNRRVVSQAVVVATGTSLTGARSVGLRLDDSEPARFGRRSCAPSRPAA